ncbi:MAG: tetratricopeptide repeat protein [Steroidobacteraceae bacterium]
MSDASLDHLAPAAIRDSVVSDALRLAQVLHARQQWAEAERLCRAILARQADHPDTLILLGIVLAQSHRPGEAEELLGRAAQRMPENAVAHINHGNVLRELGQLSGALARHERALALAPHSADAHYNLALTLSDLGRQDEALEHYARTLALSPDHAEAWNNRGALLHRLARYDEALESIDHALTLVPDYAEALGNRGAALHKLERYEEALDSLGRALVLAPDRPDTHFNRGVSLRKLQRYEEALAAFEGALALSFEHTMAHSQRGVTLGALRRFEEALASHDRALAIDPECAEAHFDRGVTLVGLRRLPDALACFDQALRLGRRDAATYRYRASVLQELNRFEEAIASYTQALAADPQTPFARGECRHARMRIADWSDFESDIAAIAGVLEREEAAAVPPFVLLSLLDSPALQRKAAETCAPEVSPRVPLPSLRLYPRHEKIRLGYFSADFRIHPVALLAAELFETHDRSRFELTAFALGPNTRDDVRLRIEAAFDSFLPVDGLSDHRIATLAREQEIDIAIDLGGYTRDSRSGIVALRAAPIQVSYLGYLGTMGADFMDYLIADPVLVPPQSRRHYCEKIAYLPSYQVNDGRRPLPGRALTRAELGLPAEGFVFCCFNNSYKITPETFDSWMRILAAAPGSVLFLLGGPASLERNLRLEAASRGIAPGRLVFGRSLPLEQYLARFRAADLFLDTLPYNAGTTASDALWAGLPVLTLSGHAFAARMAASILTAAGLPELIASDRSDYERLAAALATDPRRLADLKQRLADNHRRCALTDTGAFTAHLESLYRQMYDRHHDGLPPEHLFACEIQ